MGSVGTVEEHAQRGEVHQQGLCAEWVGTQAAVFAVQAGLLGIDEGVLPRGAATGREKSATAGVIGGGIEREGIFISFAVVTRIDQGVGFEITVDAVGRGRHGGCVGDVGQGIGIAGVVRAREVCCLRAMAGSGLVFLAGGRQEGGEQCEEEGGEEFSHAGWELKRWRVMRQN